jgi:small-conductance mechanosensitive channel
MASLDHALAQIDAAIRVRLEGLLSADQQPLWSHDTRVDLLTEFREDWSSPLIERAGRAVGYAQDHAWPIALQFILFVGLTLGLRVLRSWAARSEEWIDFLAEPSRVFDYPTATALVVSLALTPQLHPLAPVVFQRVAFTLAILPTLLIARHLLPPLMHPLVLGGLVVFLINRARGLLEFTPTLERIVLLFELLAAIGILLWLIRKSRLAQIPPELLRSRVLRITKPAVHAALVLLTVAAFAGVVGLNNLSELVGLGTLRCAYLALFIYVALKVVQSLGAYLLVLWPLNSLSLVTRNRALLRRRIDAGLVVAAVFAWVHSAFWAIGIESIVTTVVARLLTAQLAVGQVAVSFGNVLALFLTIWFSFVLARFVNWVLEEDVYPRVSLARGVPYAISSLIRYTIIVFGFMLALAAAGVELTNLTVIAGGLGVGIGFGLQNVVNNFVSGLILLFERPVQVGDAVQLPDLSGEIRRIGIRASMVRTWEGAEVIIPNGLLTSDKLTNWTLSSRERRVEVHVGVEYGTDAQRVIDLLVEVGRSHPDVISYPEPAALFLSFGDSALEFMLRVWIHDFDRGYPVRSELSVAIQRALADAGITVPFPQRDLHLRTLPPPTES